MKQSPFTFQFPQKNFSTVRPFVHYKNVRQKRLEKYYIVNGAVGTQR